VVEAAAGPYLEDEGRSTVGTTPVHAIGGPRGLQRWAAVALVATLVVLAGSAVAGSWRQTVIVDKVTQDGARTDAYQRAAHLALREIGLLQGSLREADGEERLAVAGVGARLIDALESLPDAPTAADASTLAQRRHDIQPAITRYLAALDEADVAGAQEILEEDIEEAYEDLMRVLLAERERNVMAYAASLEHARTDSHHLLVGTALTFLLGIAMLGVLGWRSRAHRRLIEAMAAHDSLTGLCNRAAFHARAQVAIARAKTDGRPPTVLVLDLDGFKDVNDSLGHHIGDLLLNEVAQRLRGSLRPHDTVARLGGDEFAVLLSDAEPQTGEQAASRISRALNDAFIIDGIVLDIEASIGIATADPGTDVATVLRHADAAMYVAKEHRLGQSRYDPRQAHETADRLTMLGDLRRALDADGEIELHYQPKIDVESGAVIGAEALARWRHPTKGLIAPGTFVPVLEGTSLIHRFTARVLDLALAQVRAWLDTGQRVPVAVNISTRCLLDSTFPDTVTQALATAGVPGDLLCVEITENTVMADPERAIEVLRRVRELGVRTAIDDFGTGYSSMAYLRILPVDEIKVDRSFVRDMATDRSNYVLVESAVDLGHNLGLTVVAEGVENEPIAGALRSLGCDMAQGYHYARPLTPADFTEFLVHWTGQSDLVQATS
jgi:diguanylate cyclase (GGDEF)-like protein